MSDEQAKGWVAWRAHWGEWDLLDEENRVIAVFDDRGGEIRDMEEKAFLAAGAPALRDALTTWLAVHDEGMVSREAAERVWRSGRLTQAVKQVRAALAAAAPPQEQPAAGAGDGGL